MLAPPTELIGRWGFSGGESRLKSAVIRSGSNCNWGTFPFWKHVRVVPSMMVWIIQTSLSIFGWSLTLILTLNHSSASVQASQKSHLSIPSGVVLFGCRDRRQAWAVLSIDGWWDVPKWEIVKGRMKLSVSCWTVLDEEGNIVGKAVKRRALSSQLLWFKLSENTQASQHLTAVRHAFPFLFLTWMPILAPQVQQTMLASHVFGSPCACGVCLLWMEPSVSGRLLRSAQECCCQTHEGLLFFCNASCVFCLKSCQMWQV